MLKALRFKGLERQRYTVPKTVHDYIPVSCVWEDGIFKVGTMFTKTFRFTDINYTAQGREDKEDIFKDYSKLLNSLDSNATTKITINNHRQNRADFDGRILMPERLDAMLDYRREYNDMLRQKIGDANGIIQEKYITVSVNKRDVEEAREYFARVKHEFISHFAALGSKCEPLDAAERLRLLHDHQTAVIKHADVVGITMASAATDGFIPYHFARRSDFCY